MIRKALLENLYRLTPLQEGMLYATLLARRPGVYVEQATWRLTGSVDPELLRASWNRLAARHAPLRTAILVRGVPQPLQAVLRERAIELCGHDLRGLCASDADRRMAEDLAADRRRGFGLSRDPLLRLALYRLADREHRMVLSFHHVVMDGWCQGPLLDELLEIYGALRDGRAPDLPSVRPYAEYIAWLGHRRPGPALDFWRGHLAGYRIPAALPRIPNPPREPCGRAETAFELDADATAGLERLAAAVQVTASTLVRALWGLALASATGRADVVFGAVVSGRPAEIPGVERMVGLFINTIPIRVRLDPQERFPALLRALHEDALRAHEHEHAALAEVQAASECGRDLLDHVLVFENYPGAGTESGARNPAGFGIEQVGMEEQFSDPLTVQVFPGERLGFRLIYDPAVFAAETMGEMERRIRAAAVEVLAEEPRALGTILRRIGAALPGAGRAGPQDGLRADARRTDGPPRTARQAAIAAIWSELLDGAAVGADDDFFALGGHSLTALRAVCRMQRDLGAEISLRQLLEHPTVAGVDALLDAPGRVPAASGAVGT